MSKEIEVYIRHNQLGAMLNFYVPKELKDSFLDSISKGTFEPSDTDIHFEASILPEWVADASKVASHVRVKIAGINVTYCDE